MNCKYPDEMHFLILLSLLKQYGIRKIVASPGSSNIPFNAAIQQDAFFEVYSSVDERSAAYIACGLAAESGEAVVLSCTGATSSRNYMSGLTEAYYRHLPVLAVTTMIPGLPGMLIPQYTDRSTPPKDVVKYSVNLDPIHTIQDRWECTVKANQAVSELFRNGGGPVHINVVSEYYCDDFSTKKIPAARQICRFTQQDQLPALPTGKIGIFVGAHFRWSDELTETVDQFCKLHNAAVFTDHTSNYPGTMGIPIALTGSQFGLMYTHKPDILIHIGQVSGEYTASGVTPRTVVWRVSPDGNMADTFKKLKYVFEMTELDFFNYYIAQPPTGNSLGYYNEVAALTDKVRGSISVDELPLSNAWLASQIAGKIPEKSVIHFGILNSLRTWNFFQLPAGTEGYCNTGGFGIDGCLSTLLGGAIAQPGKIHFCVLGDLAFFYDMNALGNRHIPKNLRILLVNNGKGSEFRLYNNRGEQVLGNDADKLIAAAGHFGNKSAVLVKHYAEDLGFTYLSASSKDEVLNNLEKFLNEDTTAGPVLFEVFTTSENESAALYKLQHLYTSPQTTAANVIRKVLGKKGMSLAKTLLGR